MQSDCLIVGAGPAGLTAAVYLARFHRSVTVLDAGESRAGRIPLSHNIPGMAKGLGGQDLLDRHREQAAVYGVTPRRGTVRSMVPLTGGGFLATVDDGSGDDLRIEARTVLVATGVRDREPALPDVENAIMRGLVRHCPVCDAFEVTGQNIAVLGQGAGAIGEAVFMRTYSRRVTLLLLSGVDALSDEDRQRIAYHDILLVEEPITTVSIEGDRIAALTTGSGTEHHFDTLYSALGADARSDIALSLGADHEKSCNAIIVDDHQRTSVPGMWAAGDVVSTLNQVAVAWGHAAVAATDIHNRLRELDQKAAAVDPGG
jgi:thioredoxin reductase (NADPH)